MNKKNLYILMSIALVFLVIIFVKSYSAVSPSGIDKNTDYSLALADAKAKGEPAFLEFYGNT